jgi:5-methylthioadenosine/S-adenosylhomocysteine deaminase
MREPIDLLIEPRWLLPMAGAGGVLEGHAVAIERGRISAVGPSAQLQARYAPREHLQRGQHALLPGFINAHVRSSLTLLRACAPWGSGADAASEARLARGAGADFVRDGTRLAMAEMLRAGITCFADLSPHPEESARTAAAAQMRVCIALPVGDEADGATAQLARAARLWDEYRADPRVSLFFALGGSAPPEATCSRVRRVADELEARIALLLQDPGSECAEVRDALPTPPRSALLSRLAALGLLRPGVAAIGSLAPGDAELIARHGAALIACPQASLRAGGAAVPLLEGERTGLGTGNPAEVGALDLLAEARTAALLSGFGAARALRLATLGSATALGLQAEVGSIEAGKAADLVCIELDALARAGSAGIEDAIVFAATRAAVTDVWSSGRPAVKERTLLSFDTQELERLPAHWSQRLKLGAAA